MKKSIIITLCLIISMLSTSVVFAMDNETIKAETEEKKIDIADSIHDLEKECVREMILEEHKRPKR